MNLLNNRHHFSKKLSSILNFILVPGLRSVVVAISGSLSEITLHYCQFMKSFVELIYPPVCCRTSKKHLYKSNTGI